MVRFVWGDVMDIAILLMRSTRGNIQCEPNRDRILTYFQFVMGNALIKICDDVLVQEVLATIEAKGKARSKKLKQASHNKSEGKKATGGCGLDP